MLRGEDREGPPCVASLEDVLKPPSSYISRAVGSFDFPRPLAALPANRCRPQHWPSPWQSIGHSRPPKLSPRTCCPGGSFPHVRRAALQPGVPPAQLRHSSQAGSPRREANGNRWVLSATLQVHGGKPSLDRGLSPTDHGTTWQNLGSRSPASPVHQTCLSLQLSAALTSPHLIASAGGVWFPSEYKSASSFIRSPNFQLCIRDVASKLRSISQLCEEVLRSALVGLHRAVPFQGPMLDYYRFRRPFLKAVSAGERAVYPLSPQLDWHAYLPGRPPSSLPATVSPLPCRRNCRIALALWPSQLNFIPLVQGRDQLLTASGGPTVDGRPGMAAPPDTAPNHHVCDRWASATSRSASTSHPPPSPQLPARLLPSVPFSTQHRPARFPAPAHHVIPLPPWQKPGFHPEQSTSPPAP